MVMIFLFYVLQKSTKVYNAFLQIQSHLMTRHLVSRVFEFFAFFRSNTQKYQIG